MYLKDNCFVVGWGSGVDNDCDADDRMRVNDYDDFTVVAVGLFVVVVVPDGENISEGKDPGIVLLVVVLGEGGGGGGGILLVFFDIMMRSTDGLHTRLAGRLQNNWDGTRRRRRW